MAVACYFERLSGSLATAILIFWDGSMSPLPEATKWAYRVQDHGRRQGSELFPIPPIECAPTGAVGGGKKARRNAVRRRDVWMESNEAIAALNCLYGCDEMPLGQSDKGRSGQPQLRSAVHESVHKHVIQSVASSKPAKVLEPRVAARELLGSRLDYLGDGTTVEDYDPDRVSLPKKQVVPVPLQSILRAETWEALQVEHLLADSDVVEWRRKNEQVSNYTDVRIRSSRELYIQFLTSLCQCGILSFTKCRKGRISPCFVKRKKTQTKTGLRLPSYKSTFSASSSPGYGRGGGLSEDRAGSGREFARRSGRC